MTSPKNSPAPAVLLGLGIPALDIARSLGRRGIEVIVVDCRPAWAGRSRYISRTLCPEQQTDDGLCRLLDAIAADSGHRPLLVPLHDDHVLFVSRHRDRLAPAYHFVMPDPEIVEGLVSKRGLWSLCRENGVPLPATHCLSPGEDLETLASRITYPCIIKPDHSRDWVRARPPMIADAQKAVEVRSPAELLALRPLVTDGYGDVVVQEVIPGPDSNLYYLVAYLDRDGRPRAAFVGRKLRTCPPCFGNGTHVESVHASEVVRLGLAVLEELGYKGCGGVEFKLDPRDGALKLIEINPRFGLWDGFAATCGLDFAYLAYADALGLPLPPSDRYRAGVRWVQPDRDFWAALDYKRSGRLTLAGWLRSLAACRVFAPYAWDDPLPGVALTLNFGRQIFQAARRRLLR